MPFECGTSERVETVAIPGPPSHLAAKGRRGRAEIEQGLAKPALAAGQTVYVHCYGGIGRTGTVVGCWLVRHGLSGA